MPTLSYVSPWTFTYDYTVQPAQARTSAPGGFKRQAKTSHRGIVTANVTRFLRGIELPYFEYFVREVCKDGSLKFTDSYIDHGGLTTGTIRIVDGAYTVETDLLNHRVTCQIEIFR